MDLEKIIAELNKRFEEPLREFYDRRIIFWNDDDGEFTEQIRDLELENAKVVVLTGSNNFEVKKLLCVDDTESNYLVYVPFLYERREDDWLLDMTLYSEEFHADIVSIWMEEMKLQQTPALRMAIKKYSKFMNAKDRRSKLSALNEIFSTEEQVERAIMAVLAGQKGVRPDQVIKAVLTESLDAEDNSIYEEFVNYELEDAFWRMVKRGTGYDAEERNLSDLAVHILLSATARTLHEDHLKGLEDKYSSAHQAYCYDLVSEWFSGKDKEKLKEIAEYVEDQIELPKRFMRQEVSDLMNTETFPCIDVVILLKIMDEIAQDNIIVEKIREVVEKRRLGAWYDEVKDYYEGILQVANMQEFYVAHGLGFHLTDPAEIWQAYINDYYQMDKYYRKFHRSFAEILKSFHSDLDDAAIQVQEKVDDKYAGWFLTELGHNWSKMSEECLANGDGVAHIAPQREFYKRYVQNADSKIYVIVSDALRYEVAVQLMQELKIDKTCKISIDSMLGIFPTITKFGMAALLPHNKLTAEVKSGKTEKLAVLADGKSTDAQYRDKILKAANPNSVALKYSNLKGSKRKDRQDAVKGMDVVYIYHDTIDAAGHDDKGVFEACDNAIEEIKNLINIITNDFGGANVVITADHGFLYTYEPLREDEKVDKTTESEQDIECGRRYAIMKEGATPEYLMPVKFDMNEEYEAFSPREVIRMKTKGGNLNFVHGGASLQELVVPVVEYHHLRSASKEYQKNKNKYDTKSVEISLVSANNKISNMIFQLKFYQKEPVGDNREAATYHLYFTDENGKVISDEVKIIADKTSDNGQDRQFRSTFNLKSQEYKNTDVYYLVITDDEGITIAKEEFQIDIAFAVDDFGF